VPSSLVRWGPVAALMAAIFILSHQSNLGGAGRIPDWITHGTAYGTLAFLTARAVGTSVRRSLLSSAAVVLACTLYGISDEIHQSFVPGRDCDPWDVVKDLGGAIGGVMVFRRHATSAAQPAGA
jgi:VanZ family protein